MIKRLFKIPFVKIQKIENYESVSRIYASIRSSRSKCPFCGKYSNRVHDYYFRTISDLPIFQSKTIILLKTRKFKCVNKQCQRKVFSEQTPAILRYSRRTERAEKLLDTLAIELTGRLGSILSKQLNLYVSSSTMTRIAHNLPLPDIVRPKVLGVDDWAYRKGVSYGTVLIDMETSRPIDLLPSRDGKVLKDWLLNNNDVMIVSRDRASSYAAAIIEACPGAIQIADRFHLLMNLSDALDTYFKSISRRIRSLITARTTDFLELPEKVPVNIREETKEDQLVLTAQETIDAKVDQRMGTFLKVKELQAKGTPIKRIATDLRMSRNTVKSYFSQESLSPIKSSRSTNIEVFTDIIVARLGENGHKLMDIFREIKKLGYTGGRTQGCYHIKRIKEYHEIVTPGYKEIARPKIPYIKPLSSRKLAKYIGCNLMDIKDHHERFYFQTLLENITEIRVVRKLVQIFKTMLARRCGNIKRWIDFVKHSKYKLAGLKSFARGLMADLVAVENGIKMSWSNGAVEGHVNRIKSIKRQMYGRASFELLRRKVILSRAG